MYLLAIVFPPLAVLLCGKPFQFLINCVLLLLLWIPAVVHAMAVVATKKADQRTDRIVQAMRQGNGQGNVPAAVPPAIKYRNRLY